MVPISTSGGKPFPGVEDWPISASSTTTFLRAGWRPHKWRLDFQPNWPPEIGIVRSRKAFLVTFRATSSLMESSKEHKERKKRQRAVAPKVSVQQQQQLLQHATMPQSRKG